MNSAVKEMRGGGKKEKFLVTAPVPPVTQRGTVISKEKKRKREKKTELICISNSTRGTRGTKGGRRAAGGPCSILRGLLRGAGRGREKKMILIKLCE